MRSKQREHDALIGFEYVYVKDLQGNAIRTNRELPGKQTKLDGE